MKLENEDYTIVKSADLVELSESIITTISLMHIGLLLESYISHLRKNGITFNDGSSRALSDRLMKNVSELIFEMQNNLANELDNNELFEIGITFLLRVYIFFSSGYWLSS